MPEHAEEGFRFLEHMTDALVEAWAPTLERAFAQAAVALFDTILFPERIRPLLLEQIRVEGHDEKELLFNWLEALLLKFEIDNQAFSDFIISPILEGTDHLRLNAEVKGEGFNPEKHGRKVEVKGVTYHLMSIEKTDGRVLLRFLLDL